MRLPLLPSLITLELLGGVLSQPTSTTEEDTKVQTHAHKKRICPLLALAFVVAPIAIAFSAGIAIGLGTRSDESNQQRIHEVVQEMVQRKELAAEDAAMVESKISEIMVTVQPEVNALTGAVQKALAGMKLQKVDG